MAGRDFFEEVREEGFLVKGVVLRVRRERRSVFSQKKIPTSPKVIKKISLLTTLPSRVGRLKAKMKRTAATILGQRRGEVSFWTMK